MKYFYVVALFFLATFSPAHALTLSYVGDSLADRAHVYIPDEITLTTGVSTITYTVQVHSYSGSGECRIRPYWSTSANTFPTAQAALVDTQYFSTTGTTNVSSTYVVENGSGYLSFEIKNRTANSVTCVVSISNVVVDSISYAFEGSGGGASETVTNTIFVPVSNTLASTSCSHSPTSSQCVFGYDVSTSTPATFSFSDGFFAFVWALFVFLSFVYLTARLL
jgi:hypothetical protein